MKSSPGGGTYRKNFRKIKKERIIVWGRVDYIFADWDSIREVGRCCGLWGDYRHYCVYVTGGRGRYKGVF